MMKLSFAPNSRAVRTAWLLEELGLPYEIERFTLGDKAMRAPEYLEKNPNGRVPTLVDGDVTICESTAIAQYLAAKTGKLAPGSDDAEFANYLQWLHYAEGMIMPHVNNFVVETLLLPPDRRSGEHAMRAKKQIQRTLAPMDAHLEGRDWLAGDFSVADTITGHAAVICVEIIGADVSAMPNLAAYIDRVKARPAFQKARAL